MTTETNEASTANDTIETRRPTRGRTRIVVGLAGALVTGVAAGASSACAHHGETASVAAPEHERPSVSLDYEVKRKGEDESIVLRGRTGVDAHHESTIEHSARDQEELRFATRPREDGSYDVQVRYHETSPDGTSIKWEPVMRVARGQTASAEVAGTGWGRAVRVKLE